VPAAPPARLTTASPDATARPSVEESAPSPAPAARAARPAGEGPMKTTAKRMQPRAPVASPPAPAAGGAPAPAPVPAHDCAHPFFVDSDGIKRFRPECM